MLRTPHLQGRRVTVMGLGQFGGGVGAVRFLSERGAHITLTDLRSETELAESLAALDGCRLDRVHLGGHREDDFRSSDLVVVNPAVRPDNQFVVAARDAGVPLSSEMNLFWQFNRAPIIGVTGSNGKSTTAALIDAMLRGSGRKSWFGGNIGLSLLPLVDEIQPSDWVVLELSSFQLAALNQIQRSPHIAVVTNFSPNHLDWHADLQDYRRAKQTIMWWQKAGDVAVLNRNDPDLATWPAAMLNRDIGAAIHWFGDENPDCVPITNDVQLNLPGRHNVENIRAAERASMPVGVDVSDIQLAVNEFHPLPHRLEFVAEIAGRRFYNDSKATTPESAIVALEAFDAPIVLLAGGYDKHLDLSRFGESIASKVKAVAFMGQTAESLASDVAKHAHSRVATRIATSFDDAFHWATAHSSSGDVVLLSPGCASYDWFPNYTARGEQFKKLVHDWSAND